MITETQDCMSLFKLYNKFEKICDRTRLKSFKKKYPEHEMIKTVLRAAEVHGISNIPILMLHMMEEDVDLEDYGWWKFKTMITSIT